MKMTTLALLLSMGLATGCANRQKEPPTPMPPTAAQLEALRANIKAYNASAKVGVVTAVLDSEQLLSIGEVADARKGEVYSIVDGEQHVVAHATVIEIKDGRVFASYEPVIRAPAAGDAAVKF